ncbi:TRAF-like zinc-finger [Dermatophagoides pteronyssinus]|uniref:TRAF-like zinc-finger n=1 Tax=Dermatophagoides pteronyssinus TaxID=6956 RepID=A0ABQ8JUF0_DERPT|nr:TRAF-like zinc-finger [Dermatophagoides pteronyssinus]
MKTSTSNTAITTSSDQIDHPIKSNVNQSSIDLLQSQQQQQQEFERTSLNNLFKHRNRLKSFSNIHSHCFHCIRPLKCIRMPVSFNEAYQLSMEEKYSMILDVDYYCNDDDDDKNNNNNRIKNHQRKQNQQRLQQLSNGYHDKNEDENDTTNIVEFCPVVRCTNRQCGMVMHYCKMKEHFLLCHYQMVSCINSHYGCPYRLLRGQMSQHLVDQCPANVVHCSAEWNRMPLYSSEKSPTTQGFCSPHSLNIHNLDVALALRDQRMLKQLWSASRQMKRIMRGRLSTHPAVPIKPYIGIRTFREFRSTVTNAQNSTTTITTATTTNNNVVDPSSINNNNNNNQLSYYNCDNNIEEEKYLNYAAKLVEHAYKESLVEILRQTAQYYRRIYMESSHDYRQQQEQSRKKSNSICSQMFSWMESKCNTNLVETNNDGINHSTINTNNDNQQLLSPTLAIQQSYPSSSSINLPIITDTDKQFMVEMIKTKAKDVQSNQCMNQRKNVQSQPPIPPPVPKCNTLSLEISIRSYAFYQPKPRAMYTFRCGLDFRKDELAAHSRDIHSDIHGGLDGWIEYRCPLFYNGCTFVHRRLWPRLSQNEPSYVDRWNRQQTTIVYNESLETFACCSVNDNDYDDVRSNRTTNISFDQCEDDDDDDLMMDDDNKRNESFDHQQPSSTSSVSLESPSFDDENNHRIMLTKTARKNSTSACGGNGDSIISTSHSSSSYSLLYSNNNSSVPLLLMSGKGGINGGIAATTTTTANNTSSSCISSRKSSDGNIYFSLNNLPFELLQNICKYLDGFSLNNLSFTSKRMRMVVQSFVKKKGYVVLQWKRFEMEKGKFQWRVVYKKWLFSTAMQPIRGWRIDSDNVMAHHLQVCPFYERNIRTEPFRICEFDPSILPNHNASSMSTTTTIITK